MHPWRSTLTRWSVCLLALLSAAAVGAAQAPQRRTPRATVTTILEKDGVTPGGTAYAAVKVVLPEKLHCNSHTPRDKGLIRRPHTATEGVAVAEIVYPQRPISKREAQQPLSVSSASFARRAAERRDSVGRATYRRRRFRYQGATKGVLLRYRVHPVKLRVGRRPGRQSRRRKQKRQGDSLREW